MTEPVLITDRISVNVSRLYRMLVFRGGAWIFDGYIVHGFRLILDEGDDPECPTPVTRDTRSASTSP